MSKRDRQRSVLNAEDSFIEDVAVTNVSKETQLRCTFNASYLRFLNVGLEFKAIAKELRVPDVRLITNAFDAINASNEDQLMTLRTQQWPDALAPTAPMPCSLAYVVELAERTLLGTRNLLNLQ